MAEGDSCRRKVKASSALVGERESLLLDIERPVLPVKPLYPLLLKRVSKDEFKLKGAFICTVEPDPPAIGTAILDEP